jgi:5'-methylthioadenosine phosphorylase
MEGPPFSTVAESKMHQAWGGDLIGMTVMPEAKLAREAEICYALIALPTDYDCWRPHDPGKTREALLGEIIGNLQAVTAHAIALLAAALPAVAAKLDEPCSCRDALAMAIWSDKSKVAPAVVERLKPIVGRYF